MKNSQRSDLHKTLLTLEAPLHTVYTQEQLPGISAVIVHQQEIIWRKSCGYADLAQQRPADAQTIYGIGSITKIFTAIMLMQLCEAGRLQLHNPVARYLPEIGQLQTETPITLRQLASHTAGLPPMPPLPELLHIMQEFPPQIETLRQMTFPTGEQMLTLLPTVVPLSKPGDHVRYSNLGVALLAQALERAAGQDYAAYVTEHILRPLGIQQSGFRLHELPATQLATCYLPFGSPLVAAPPEMKNLRGLTPAGGLHASANDIARFLISLARIQAGQTTILSPQSFAEMTRPVAHLAVSHYTGTGGANGVGIGWFLSTCKGHILIEHGGADPTMAAYLAYAPSMQVGVFAATNTGNNPAAIATMAYNFLEQLLSHLEQKR